MDQFFGIFSTSEVVQECRQPASQPVCAFFSSRSAICVNSVSVVVVPLIFGFIRVLPSFPLSFLRSFVRAAYSALLLLLISFFFFFASLRNSASSDGPRRIRVHLPPDGVCAPPT